MFFDAPDRSFVVLLNEVEKYFPHFLMEMILNKHPEIFVSWLYWMKGRNACSNQNNVKRKNLKVISYLNELWEKSCHEALLDNWNNNFSVLNFLERLLIA